jgi:hypothetical protein
MTSRTLTQAQLIAEATAAFGDDPLKWAFRCPHCGDVATPQDFRDAGADPNRIGQECIGRYLGALAPSGTGRPLVSRGCDWAAYGLFRGPWLIEMPNGNTTGSFPLAIPEAGEQA